MKWHSQDRLSLKINLEKKLAQFCSLLHQLLSLMQDAILTFRLRTLDGLLDKKGCQNIDKRKGEEKDNKQPKPGVNPARSWRKDVMESWTLHSMLDVSSPAFLIRMMVFTLKTTYSHWAGGGEEKKWPENEWVPGFGLSGFLPPHLSLQASCVPKEGNIPSSLPHLSQKGLHDTMLLLS